MIERLRDTTKRRAPLFVATGLALFMAAGCHKKAAPPPPPPAPPASAPAAAKPTISYFAAEPDSVNSGQPSQLRWSVTDATTVEIDNTIGTVSPSGRRAVYPNATTTYTLTASNSGGSSTAAVTVTVTSAPPPAAPPPAPTQSAAEILARQVQDLHFDYDKSDIRAEDQPVLQADANALKTIFGMDASFVVTVEGHCDERGSGEYNLGLGDRRASAVKDALVQMGLPADKLKTISYGKERPLCTEAAEECYARNRRAHFSTGQQ